MKFTNAAPNDPNVQSGVPLNAKLWPKDINGKVIVNYAFAPNAFFSKYIFFSSSLFPPFFPPLLFYSYHYVIH